MKTIIALAHNENQLAPIVNTCNSLDEDVFIIPVKNENEAITTALKKSVDLIICDISDRPPSGINELVRFTYTVPYVPCIAIIHPILHQVQDVLRLGVSSCLESPFQPSKLYRWASELFELSTSGVIKGLPVHSLLQVIETEKKSCTLKIQAKGERGFLFIESGIIIAAEFGELRKENAVYSLIVLENSVVEIRHYNGLRRKDIHQNTTSLIMEAFRLQDERKSLEKKQKQMNLPRLNLKQFSTANSSFKATIGTKLKLEFNESQNLFMSSFVGIISEGHLIITTPDTVGEDTLYEGMEVLIRYLDMGKLYMFKTVVNTMIKEPHNLLFLEYPSVIFYHELRRKKRTITFIPCTLKLLDDLEYHCVITDLSIKGCLCEIKAKRNIPFPDIETGVAVSLNCLLPGIDKKEIINGHVRNIKKSNLLLQLGIEFEPFTKEIEHSIRVYLKSIDNITSIN